MPAAEDIRTGDLRDTAERLALMGRWEWRPEQGALFWSDNLFRMFGFDPGEIEPSPTTVKAYAHPDDVDAVAAERDRLRHSARPGRVFEYRIVRSDREVRHLRSTITTVERGDSPLIVGFVQDITEIKRAERSSDMLIAVANTLGAWESVEASGPALLEALGRCLDMAAGVLWIPDDGSLVARLVWKAESMEHFDIERFVAGRRVPRGLGLAGGTWAAGTPRVLVSAFEDAAFEEGGPARAAELRGGLAFPALEGDAVLAVLEFFARNRIVADERLNRSLIGIGHELGHFLDRQRRELEPATLTPRQREVLKLAANGKSANQIASALGVSRDTVKTHLKNIYLRLEVNDRVSAVTKAMRMGLVE